MITMLISFLMAILVPCDTPTAWYERGPDDTWFYVCGDEDGAPVQRAL